MVTHRLSPGGEGAEVVYALRNNDTLANMVLNNIGDEGQIKRKVYQRRLPEDPSKDYYYIIRETDPAESILVEYGFIDNQKDLNKLQNKLTDYAEGVVKAIANYTNTPYTPPGQSSTEGNYYIVAKGDTLWSIANKYGITVDELINYNNLPSSTISIGQELKIPTGEVANPTTYTVQSGDTLWSISRKYNVSVNDIIQANNLSSSVLQIGQTLIIP